MTDATTHPLIEATVKLLNEALRADPDAIRAVFNHRAPCNDTLADHPTIPIKSNPDGTDPEVSPLGLINGILAKFCGQKICAAYDLGDDAEILHFLPYNPDPEDSE